ncbi:unnamed protein product [Linum trigynum]|uniref:Uncharacterized protein n=1 Tax=Linum trigynum TaxID=586398 RepID=A0AAV2CE07_9ROSI
MGHVVGSRKDKISSPPLDSPGPARPTASIFEHRTGDEVFTVGCNLQRHHSWFNRRQLQFQKAKSMALAGFPLQSKHTRPVPTIGACITSLSACKFKSQSRAHLLPRLPSPCIPIESASIAQHNGHSSHQKQPGSLRFW